MGTGQVSQFSGLRDVSPQQNEEFRWPSGALHSLWMYTFRLSKGRTSSELIFWLIPAMRRKDRRGPGIVNCDAAETVPSSGTAVTTASEVELLAEGCSPVRAISSQLTRENATRKHRQRGDFTAGSLAGAGETLT